MKSLMKKRDGTPEHMTRRIDSVESIVGTPWPILKSFLTTAAIDAMPMRVVR
jgi:hypothetical protein